MSKNSQTRNRLPDWEEHLVVRAQAGDSVAFEMLCDMHRAAVFGQALKILRDPEDAQDAAQETFLKACKALGSFQAGRPMQPWLLRICSNCAVDIIRGRRNRAECIETYEHTLSDDSESAEKTLEEAEGSEQILEAIKRLPQRYREIVVLRHYRQMDVMEIAEFLGKPEGTVKSWLFRARALLRKDLSSAIPA